MTDAEHFEIWLKQLQEEQKDYKGQLEVWDLQRKSLNLKKRVLDEMLFEYGFEKELLQMQLKEHLDYATVLSELKELNSDAQQLQEDILDEKIRFLQLTIDKVEKRLPHVNTPS